MRMERDDMRKVVIPIILAILVFMAIALIFVLRNSRGLTDEQIRKLLVEETKDISDEIYYPHRFPAGLVLKNKTIRQKMR